MHNHEFFHFLTRILRFACSFMSVIFWLLLIYGFDEPCTAGLTVASALIHEAGHILYFSLLSRRGVSLRGVPSGLRLGGGTAVSYSDEILGYASGPLANFAACVIALPLLPLSEGYVMLFILLNLATAVSNLMPIKGYDGYGIAATALEAWGIGTRLLEAISFVIKCFAAMLALYLMERLGEGYWLFGVFFFSIVGEIWDSAFLKK